MPSEERRDALIEATVPLLAEHGRAVTTKLIAEAAGVAEGTIFRVFASKEELIDETLQRAFDWGDFVERVNAIDLALPLERRMIDLVALLQARYQAIFGLMRSVGMVAPPHAGDCVEEKGRRIEEILVAMSALLSPDSARFQKPLSEVVHLLRLLTFSGSHPDISQAPLLKPAEIVGVVLHGVLKENP